MTRTGPADAVLPACRRAAAGRPVLTRPRDSRGLAPIRLVAAWSSTAWSSTAWSAAGVPAVVRAVFPGEGPFKPVPGRRPPCSVSPPHRLYLYVLKRPAVALSGCPFDPGRDMLCILTSPPRWLQWP
jgi:hypothetical protein